MNKAQKSLGCSLAIVSKAQRAMRLKASSLVMFEPGAPFCSRLRIGGANVASHVFFCFVPSLALGQPSFKVLF